MRDWRFVRLFEPEHPLGDDVIEAYAKAMEANNANSDDLPAGYTYFGQLVAHDLSELRSGTRAPRPRAANISELVQLRKPALDLDSMYGAGLDDSTVVFENNGKFRLGKVADGSLGDLYRRSDGTPLIADPRNDENLLVAQMLLLFMRFHNALIDSYLLDNPCQGLTGRQLFEMARKEVVASYRWAAMYDLADVLVPCEIFKEIVVKQNGHLMDRNNTPSMCVEFAGAAFRLGHSMVRESYRFNGERFSLTQLFDLTGRSITENRPLAKHAVVDWLSFFDFREYGYGPDDGLIENRAHKIDTASVRLAQEPTHDIIRLDLLRGQELGLATGQQVFAELSRWHPDVAERVGLKPIEPERVFPNLEPKYLQSMPLWAYILAEAELHGEDPLGPLGGWLVADALSAAATFASDAIDPDWRPSTSVVQTTNRLNGHPAAGGPAIQDIIVFTIESELALNGRAERRSRAMNIALLDAVNLLGKEFFGTSNHEYADWLVASVANTVSLEEHTKKPTGGWEVKRLDDPDDWPQPFSDYLPKGLGNEKFKILTAPGWNNDGEDCVVIFLGSDWSNQIRKDLWSARLKGDSSNVSDGQSKRSQIGARWQLEMVEIRTLSDSRDARLIFYHRDNRDTKFVAAWGWTIP